MKIQKEKENCESNTELIVSGAFYPRFIYKYIYMKIDTDIGRQIDRWIYKQIYEKVLLVIFKRKNFKRQKL